MTIMIRKFENSEHEYIAYVKSIFGKATYLVYFLDDIRGAVVLCNFVRLKKIWIHNAFTMFRASCLSVLFQESFMIETCEDQAQSPW